MYCFNFFRNQLWQHLISYNSFRNMNMCLLEVATCEKCRSSHFQWKGGGGDGKKIEDCGGRSVPHYMPWHTFVKNVMLDFTRSVSKVFIQSNIYTLIFHFLAYYTYLFVLITCFFYKLISISSLESVKKISIC